MSAATHNIERKMQEELEKINKTHKTNFILKFNAVPKESDDLNLPKPSQIAFLKYEDGSEERVQLTEQEQELAYRYKKLQEEDKAKRIYQRKLVRIIRGW